MKMLYIEDGKIQFKYGTGKAIEGHSNVADGQNHVIALRYIHDIQKWTIFIDGEFESMGVGVVQDV